MSSRICGTLRCALLARGSRFALNSVVIYGFALLVLTGLLFVAPMLFASLYVVLIKDHCFALPTDSTIYDVTVPKNLLAKPQIHHCLHCAYLSLTLPCTPEILQDPF